MLLLIGACAFFVFIHFAVSGTRWRDALVARLGEGLYLSLFSLASFVAIFAMGYGYAIAPNVSLWGTLLGLRPAVFAVVLVSALLVAIGLATPNPTNVGSQGKLAEGAAAVRGIVRITRHPFLWGVGLWALAHLVVNGDLASLILFGTLALNALVGTALIDAKCGRRFADRWQPFAARTSNVPFGAILAGRNQLAPALREIGWLRPAIGLALYALLFVLHGRVIAPLT
jgi:uncharacterized membrane protein